MKSFTLFVLLFMCLSVFSQQTDSIRDNRDGQVYKIVKIGNQWWMAQNLNYKTKTGSTCANDSAQLCEKCGRVYLWDSAQHACPRGWHLPSEAEFDTLLANYGGETTRVYFALLKGGKSGFNALLCLHLKGGDYNPTQNQAYYWSNVGGRNAATCLSIGGEKESADIVDLRTYWKVSVRCIKNK